MKRGEIPSRQILPVISVAVLAWRHQNAEVHEHIAHVLARHVREPLNVQTEKLEALLATRKGTESRLPNVIILGCKRIVAMSDEKGRSGASAGRVTEAAAAVFGNHDVARRWLRTKNFALGGIAPRDLLKTSEGERVVLNELQAQAEGGPI